MKKRKTLLLVLCLVAALCLTVAFAACKDNGAHKDSYNDGDVIIDDKDIEYTYFDSEGGFAYNYTEKRYDVKFLAKDGSKSYITLQGEGNDKLSVVGYKGGLTKLSLKEIEEAVKLNDAGISIVGIADGAFKGCNTLIEADLTKVSPSLEFVVGKEAFSGCSALTSVTLPQQMYIAQGNSVGDFAFANCPVLSTVTMTESIDEIGAYAFAGCQSLLDISLSNNVSVIREGTFAMCDSLSSFVGAANLRSIQASAFEGTALTSFDFSDFPHIVYIGDAAFRSTQLTEVNIPDTVTYIGDRAFRDIDSLTEVEIPFLGYSVANSSGWRFNSVYGMTTPEEGVDRSLTVRVAATPYIPSGAFSQSVDLKSLTIDAVLKNDNYNVYNSDGVTYNRHSVTSSKDIPTQAFYGCKNLVSLSLPKGVESIGSSAFEGCKSLPAYTMPTTLEYIGERAFRNCQSLKQIALPESLDTIGDQAFYGCHGITTFTLPANLEYVGFGILGDCISLTNLTVEQLNSINYTIVGEVFNATVYPDNLFAKSSEVFTEYDQDETLAPVYNSASGAFIPKSLTTVTLGEVNALPSNAFNGWKYLETVTISLIESPLPNYNGYNTTDTTVPYDIQANAFKDCLALKTVTINDSEKIQTIGEMAFYNCRELTSFIVPSDVKTISSQAFYGCRKLTSITFPESVTSYGSAILGDCISLESITINKYNWLESQSLSSYKTLKTAPLSGLFSNSSVYETEYNEGSSGSWLRPENKMYYNAQSNVYLPNSLYSVALKGVNILADKAFAGWTNLSSASVTFRDAGLSLDGHTRLSMYIGNNAFYNCENLTYCSVMNTDKLEAIGDYAFYYCINLKSAPTSIKLTSIGQYAFYGCQSLTSYTIPHTATTLGNAIFGDCISLKSLTIKGYNYFYNGELRTVTTSNLFAKTSNHYNDTVNTDKLKIHADYNGYYIPDSLKNITLGGVHQIADNAFRNWKMLERMSIGFNESNAYYTTTIGTSAFNGCEALANINFTMLDRLAVIKDFAFAYTAISEFELPSSLTTLGSSVFAGCEALSKVKFAEGCSLFEIKEYTFSDCAMLEIIDIPSGTDTIGSYAFQNCEALKSVIVPASLNTVNIGAFSGCTALESVFYCGSDWHAIAYTGNTAFTNATRYLQNTTNCVHDASHWRKLDDGAVSTELTIGEPEVLREPTCTEAGSSKATCTICDETFVFDVPALGHDLPVTVEATCETTGTKSGTCNRCGITTSEVIPALGHKASSWTVAKEPTCDTAGERVKICTVCNEVLETEAIEKLTHDIVLKNDTLGCANCDAVYASIENDPTYAWRTIDGVLTSTNKLNNSVSKYTITAVVSMTISFKYMTSCEKDYDYFKVIRNEGTSQATTVIKTSGIQSTYTSYSVTLNAGDTLTFSYSKDSSSSDYDGEDCVRIADLTVLLTTPPIRI